jgi:nucleoside-diphosphate-sugar epimerase
MRRAVTLPCGVTFHAIGDITAATDWSPVLQGARAVVHLASRAHAPPGADQGWIKADAAAAAQLARAAGRAGVERLLLLSSIKVLGEATDGVPFRAGRPAAPEDAYGFAKWCLEDAMRGAAGPALTVIRPPLVYGPGVKGNFRALLRLVDRALPLPFAAIVNRRSLAFLDNLIDLVELALTHPAARDGTFLLRDDEEVSTPDLVRRIARALGRPARLFPCPPALLRLAARAAGRGAAADRLLGSLSIDDWATRDRLGWRPRMALDEGLARTCRWYRSEMTASHR